MAWNVTSEIVFLNLSKLIVILHNNAYSQLLAAFVLYYALMYNLTFNKCFYVLLIKQKK